MSIPTIRGLIPTPPRSTPSASRSGCAGRARSPRFVDGTSWRRCRSPATAPSAPRCWPSCASTRRSAATASTTSSGGRASRWRKAPPRCRRLAAELGHETIRLGATVRRIEISAGRARVTLTDGEAIAADAVVCTIPAGPLRAVEIAGVSDARLRSLRSHRSALAAKVVAAYEASFWREAGQNGLAECEWLFGSTWPQREGVLSMLVPPERLSAFLATPEAVRSSTVVDYLVALNGERARFPVAMLEPSWGVDPFTQGNIASWAPGDLTRVGPLHGTHEPPLYVAGSDHWVAGYMEGAVRTGRDAARAALGAGSRA
ncbi:MAG TPA: FAD-dependent oxidoreductase [Solirubrobacteraceae bacterium]|nr:FAD-dependent oxidoreductase [Solirubrobacteraceae bacterium]